MAINVRTRSLPFTGGNGKLTQWTRDSSGIYPGATLKSTWSVPSLVGRQVTASENHPSWRSRNRGLSDVGGDFSSKKTYVESEIPTQSFSGEEWNGSYWSGAKYTGFCTSHSLASVVFPPDIASGLSTLDAWGAKAIALCKPTNPIVDLSTALGEVATGGIPRFLPDLWRERTQSALKAGSSDYLNVEFGWKPIISDVLSLWDAVERADQIMSQYVRDAGRQVRRRWNFSPVQTSDTTLITSSASPWYSPSSSVLRDSALPAVGKVYRTRESTIRRWYSGAFTYHLPSFNWDVGAVNASEAKRLFGLSPTPETLWNLTPWSWAVDWFSSMGDVISNLSDYATDGLVMRYGYMMEHSICKDTYTWSGPTQLRNRAIIPSPVSLVCEVKMRRRANPFGFGLTWSGLSPRQLSIAAAIGLTR